MAQPTATRRRVTDLPDAEADAWRAFQGQQPVFASPLMGPDFARAVGRDPMDGRIDNLVTPALMPYVSVCDMRFDNGDYPESVRRDARLVDYQAGWSVISPVMVTLMSISAAHQEQSLATMNALPPV